MTGRQCPVCGAVIDAAPRPGRPRQIARCARHRWRASQAAARARHRAHPPRAWTAEERAEADTDLDAWLATLPKDPFADLA